MNQGPINPSLASNMLPAKRVFCPQDFYNEETFSDFFHGKVQIQHEEIWELIRRYWRIRMLHY